MTMLAVGVSTAQAAPITQVSAPTTLGLMGLGLLALGWRRKSVLAWRVICGVRVKPLGFTLTPHLSLTPLLSNLTALTQADSEQA